MEREAIISKIRSLKPALAHANLDRIRLFGSAARNDMKSQSDIDVLLDFSQTPTLGDLSEIQVKLTEELGSEVDIAMADSLLPELRDRIMSEAIDV
jgi:predicted nucleotidyltransferase